MSSEPASPLFPLRPFIMAEQIHIRLATLSRDDFRTPFFDQQKNSLHDALHSDIDSCAMPAATIPLRAFIFHVSHAGSTLLAQMLGALPQHRVVSEPEIVNTILMHGVLQQLPETQTAARLLKAVALLTQPLHANEAHAFIKFSSWNIFHVQLIRKCFPQVPCIFLHRNPASVIRSLQKDPNGFATWHRHAAPLLAATCLGISPAQVQQLDETAYLAAMLGLHLQCAMKLQRDTLSLCYPGWLQQFEDVVLPFLQLRLSPAEKAAMLQRTVYNAKQPQDNFTEAALAGTIPDTGSAYKQLMDTWQQVQEYFSRS